MIKRPTPEERAATFAARHPVDRSVADLARCIADAETAAYERAAEIVTMFGHLSDGADMSAVSLRALAAAARAGKP